MTIRIVDTLNQLQEKYEHLAVYVLICILWVKDTLLTYCRGIIDGIPFLATLYDAVFMAAVVFCGFLMLKRVKRRMHMGDWCFVAGAIILYAITIYLTSAGTYASAHFPMFFFQVLPFYVLGVCLPEKQEHKRDLYTTLFLLSAASAVAAFAYMFYFLATGRSFSGPNNMDMSYKNIMQIMFVVWYAAVNKNRIAYIASAAGLVFLLAMGTRGVQLTALIWILICFVFTGKKIKEKLIVVGIGAGCIVLLFATGMIMPLAKGMKDLFDSLGLNSRVFSFILDSSIFDGNGREELWIPAVEALSILPGGLLYDRVVLDSHYVHNIILELLLDFGILLGLCVLLLLVYWCFRAVVRAKSLDRWFLLQLGVLCAIKLMLSSSYLNEPYFFFMIGVASCFGRQYPQRRLQIGHDKSIII